MKTKLRKVRLEKGLSQEYISEELGVSQSQYCRRENGIIPLSEKEWDRLSDILGVNKDDIFEENHTGILVNNGENSGNYSGSYNNFGNLDAQLIEKILNYVNFLEKKIEEN